MLSFTTDDLRPQDRFDHWCEVRGKTLFGVTIELERPQRSDFYGRFSARGVGGAIVSDMQASSYRIGRTNADIARMSGNSLCIGLQVRGPGMLETGRGSRQYVQAGSLTISHSDLPFQATPERSDGFEYRMLKIPLSADLLVGARGHDLFAAGLPHTAPQARPLEALFMALTRADVPPTDAESDVVHAARLALIIRGRLAAGSVEGRAALRAGYLHAARQILARDLRRPDLSPERVAAELGISLRQVHVLFEPTGQSFSRTLTTLRVREAAQLLRARPSRPVADVAFHCGFESLSAFYRAFQGVYGMTPRDLRQAESEPRRTRPQPEAAMA
ncbi:AraC family transcriptional regulator [Azorhizobium oxalatiphilum]|uniref:AraC family transcriptional regulator n=1 Tax=Azorhizobium oxalatiphilum TaxID=980631 RepID=A0A917BZW9_9HYPH|nr:AraC family transcriptional regulator [Azorhizobium oxalatiphilum]GGF65022.1 AraC family transcriptional regulator [Azorhizobium oxalatiphilum]